MKKLWQQVESSSFDEFINRINYDEEACHKQQNELRHWLEMIGVYKYNKYYEVLHKESFNITFDDLKNCATYDFNLSRILYAMLKHCENYLRATITSNIDDFPMNKKDRFSIIQEKFGSKLGSNFKIYWPNSLTEVSSFYRYIDASGFATIIVYYLTLPENRIIFDLDEVRDNLFSLKGLRNRVYHHNCLLDDNFKVNELKSKTMMLFRYMPSPITRGMYIELIEEEFERVGDKFSYPIHFSVEEQGEILNYRGCNNEYKN